MKTLNEPICYFEDEEYGIMPLIHMKRESLEEWCAIVEDICPRQEEDKKDTDRIAI